MISQQKSFAAMIQINIFVPVFILAIIFAHNNNVGKLLKIRFMSLHSTDVSLVRGGTYANTYFKKRYTKLQIVILKINFATHDRGT